MTCVIPTLTEVIAHVPASVWAQEVKNVATDSLQHGMMCVLEWNDVYEARPLGWLALKIMAEKPLGEGVPAIIK